MRFASCIFGVVVVVPLLASAEDVKCDTPLLALAERFFGVSSPLAIAGKLLGKVQDECHAGKCPHVNVGSCKNQSVDDVHCELPVATTSVKLGTDGICDAGCSNWPCIAGCQGIDVGICYGADYILCKGGCLGIKPCVKACEKKLVDPCKEALIKKCKTKCDATFSKCKENCEKEMAMNISISFERLQRPVSSMAVTNLAVNCTGDGILRALNFQANTSVEVGDVALDLKVHTKDAGISSTQGVSLDKIKLSLQLPLDGNVHCGIGTHAVNISLGQFSITSFNLDVSLQLDKTLDKIASVICAGLSVCKDAIKKSINKAIKDVIVREVPTQAAKQIQPILQQLTQSLTCPHFPVANSQPTASLSLVV